MSGPESFATPSSEAQQYLSHKLIFCYVPSAINCGLIVQIEVRHFKERLNLEALKHAAIRTAQRKDQMRLFQSVAIRPISLDAIQTGNVLCKV